MRKKSIEAAVKEVLGGILMFNEEELTPRSNLQDDLGMDSLDRVEIAMEIEENIIWPAISNGTQPEIPDEVAAAWVVVDDVIRSVEKILETLAEEEPVPAAKG